MTLAQKLLREDLVDKVLKRDMTALFGGRRIVDAGTHLPDHIQATICFPMTPPAP